MIVHSPQHRESAFVLGGCFVLGCALLTFGFLNREAPRVTVQPRIEVHAPAQGAPVVHVAAPELPTPHVTVQVPTQEPPQVFNILPLPVGSGAPRTPSCDAATPSAEVVTEALDRAQWGALLPRPKK